MQPEHAIAQIYFIQLVISKVSYFSYCGKLVTFVILPHEKINTYPDFTSLYFSLLQKQNLLQV